MKRKLSHYIKPSFWVFLLIAILLWYGDKLGNRYTTEVVLPVEVQNDFSSKLWIEKPTGEVNCRVEGVGGRLMAYKLKLGERIVIPMSQLTLLPIEGTERMFRVDKSRYATLFLSLGYSMNGQRGLSGRFRSVYFDDTPFGIAAYT